MGNITISLEDDEETRLRNLAKRKFSGKKGSISRVIAEGIKKLEEEERREKAKERLLEMAGRGFNLGGIAARHRGDLYAR